MVIRTALLSTLAALGLGSAASAQVYFPQVPVVRPHHGHVHHWPPRLRLYEVEFRVHPRDRWRTHTVTANHDYAHILARYLRHQGYQARVDH